jgi:hypothetical protein
LLGNDPLVAVLGVEADEAVLQALTVTPAQSNASQSPTVATVITRPQ